MDFASLVIGALTATVLCLLYDLYRMGNRVWAIEQESKLQDKRIRDLEQSSDFDQHHIQEITDRLNDHDDDLDEQAEHLAKVMVDKLTEGQDGSSEPRSPLVVVQVQARQEEQEQDERHGWN